MAKAPQKTQVEQHSAWDFIAALALPRRQAEARQLLAIYGQARGYAPRRADLSLYGLKCGPESEALLARMGKHRAAVSCVYVRHLAAINPEVLANIIRAGLRVLKARYPVLPT